MKAIDNYEFKEKTALIRVDFNVPIDKETFEIIDDTRIKRALPTINKVLKEGGSVVIMSHLGRPKNGYENRFSLKHIVNHLSKLLKKEVLFVNDCIGKNAFEVTSGLERGKVVLLENLRFYKQEITGTESFAKELSKHADLYINDAFGTAHRAHASTTIIAKFFPNDKMFGYLIESEIESVNKVLNSNEKPLTAIVGGAKVSSKIVIIKKLLEKVDYLIIGGGMAYTFIKAQGGKIGNSLVEDDYISVANEILQIANKKGVKICLPSDTVIADKFSNDALNNYCDINKIPDGWMGLDIYIKSIEYFCKIIEKSKLILWNGPMGVFEMKSFQKGTEEVAKAISKATSKGAFSLIGGGDSVAAINKFDLANQVSYVSTGGGAMLEYLEGIELPGISAILN